MNTHFDVIVVGGGHAGIEAAYATSKMGSKTLLLTLDIDKVAAMPCNPSIGGLGKGHIVFEISALGGLMPQLCTKTYLQARMLNTSKGPAVHGLRLQIDKYAYSQLAKKILLNTPNLSIYNHTVTEIFTRQENNKKIVTGVQTSNNKNFHAPNVIITAGTFLKGLIHVGQTRYKAGRRGEKAIYGLSQSIATTMGTTTERLKTGTPPRLLKQSIDYSQIEKQKSSNIDYLYGFEPVAVQEKLPCFITHTNKKTHDIILKNISRSALYGGNIKGTGPRYCPSIEDKIGRYPDRSSHHVFIEPEGEFVNEIYPAGLSTSLPLEVQQEYIRSIKGFENAEIIKCGYAVEYDFIQPTNLSHTLETKSVKGLFLAGQINGTTGYEEAAGQGLVAGINAHLLHSGKEPFILNRTESYIGVMIDDLVTLGADEPYRMFTSRAERRLILRQDNAFLRLMPYGKQLGLVSDQLYQKFLQEKEIIEQGVRIAKESGPQSQLFKILRSTEFSLQQQEIVRSILIPKFKEKQLQINVLSSRTLLTIHAEIKYDGYIQKEKCEVEKAIRYQQLKIPKSFSYKNQPGLTIELQQKLTLYKPQTIAQAQLIPGITPAAISILIFHIKSVDKHDKNQSKY